MEEQVRRAEWSAGQEGATLEVMLHGHGEETLTLCKTQDRLVLGEKIVVIHLRNYKTNERTFVRSLKILQSNSESLLGIFRCIFRNGLNRRLRFDNRISERGQRGEDFRIRIG